jgi:hypothetical protein
MEAWTTIIGSIITGMATILSVWMGRKILKRRKSDPVVSDTARSANVYTALQYTINALKGDRAYVLEFHNGGHYYSGRGQQKFSCTHEIAADGITKECNNSQEHRCSNYHTYISELIEKDSFCYIIAQDAPDHAFRNMLITSGVQSIINVPIKTLSGKIIGILGVDFVKGQAPQGHMGFGANSVMRFDDEALKFIKAQSNIIAGYLL